MGCPASIQIGSAWFSMATSPPSRWNSTKAQISISRAVSTNALSRAQTNESAISMRSPSRNSSESDAPHMKRLRPCPRLFRLRTRHLAMKETASDLKRKFHGPSDIQVRSRRALQAAILLCAPFVLLYATFRFVGIRINFTSSLERGFYVVSQRPSANLVEFCPEGE